MEQNLIEGLAQRTQALRQIGAALKKGTATHFPPNPNLKPEALAGLSWRVHLLPFLGHGELYLKFKHFEPWDSKHNKALLAQMPDVYKTTEDATKTTFLMVVGKGTGYEGGAGIAKDEFSDGLANTALVVDAGRERAVPWTKPEDLPFDRKDPIRAFGTSDFGDVFLALMADGSAQSIPYDTAPESLRALFTRAGGDSFDPTAKRTTPLPVQPVVLHFTKTDGDLFVRMNGEDLSGIGDRELLTKFEGFVKSNPELVVKMEGELAVEDVRTRQFQDFVRLIELAGVDIGKIEWPAAIERERLKAEAIARSNSMRNIGKALHGYHEKHKTFPPTKGNPDHFDEDGQPLLSWRVHILPWLEQEALYDDFRLDEPWDSEHNRALLAKMPAIFKTTDDPTRTTLLAVVGEGTAYEGKAGLNFHRDFTDGESNTALVVDAGRERAVPWTKPEDLPLDTQDPIRAFGTSDFGDVFLALMADGSVRSIARNTAPDSLQALFTRAGGDSFEPFAKRTTPLPQPVEGITLVRRFEGHVGTPTSVVFTPDGRRLVSSASWPKGENDVYVWDAASGRELGRLIGHAKPVETVAISPDGRQVATASYDGSVRVWNAETFAEQMRFEVEAANTVAFSNDGRFLFAGGTPLPDTYGVICWNLETKQEAWHFTDGVPRQILSLAPTPDGRQIAASGHGVDGKGTVHVLDAATGRELRRFDVPEQGVVVAVSPDRRRLAGGGNKGGLFLWDLASGEVVGSWPRRHAKQINEMAFTADGRHLVTGGWDGFVRVTRIPDGEVVLELEHPANAVGAMTLSPDGRSLVTGGGFAANPPGKHPRYDPNGDFDVRLWRLAESVWPQDGITLVRNFEGHTGTPTSVAFTPDGRRMASSAAWPKGENEVRIWEVDTGREIGRLTGHTKPVDTVAYSPDGTRLATASFDGSVRVWDAATYREQMRFETVSMNVTAFSVDGRLLFAGGRITPDEYGVICWNLETKQEVWRFTDVPRQILSFAMTPDGSRLVASGLGVDGQGTIHLLDTGSGRKLQQFDVPQQDVQIALSPDAKWLAGGGNGGGLYLWNLRSGDRVGDWPQRHRLETHTLAFTPDGRHLISGGWDSKVFVTEVPTGDVIAELDHPAGAVATIAISPDGRSLVSGGGFVVNPPNRQPKFDPNGDYRVRLWRLPESLWPEDRLSQEDSFPKLLEGHTGPVSSLAVSPDGKRIVSAAKDKTVRVWDVETGKQLAQWHDHEHWVYSAIFSPDGRNILTAGRDKTLRIWDAATGEAIRRIDLPGQGGYLAMPQHGTEIAVCGDFGAHVYEFKTGKKRLELERTYCFSINYLPHGGIVLDRRGYVRRYDARDGKELWRTPFWKQDERSDDVVSYTFTESILKLAISPDGTEIAACGHQGIIYLLNAKDGTITHQWQAHDGLAVVQFSPDGKRLFSAGRDKKLRMWDAATGKLLDQREAESYCTNALVVLPDGKRVVTGGGERWDEKTGTFKSTGNHALHLWQLPESVWPEVKGDAALRKSLSALVELKADGLTPNEAEQWMEREAPSLNLDSPLTHKALQLLAELPAESHERLLADGYLRWRPDQFDPRRRAQHSEIVQWYVGWAFRNVPPAGGEKGKREELTAQLLENADVGFAVVDLPQPDGAMICWCLIAREELPFPGSFPLIGMPSEVEKARGEQVRVAQADRLRELRDLPVSPVPEGGWPAAETPTYEALRKQAVVLYTFEKDTFYKGRVLDKSGNGNDALLEGDEAAYTPDGKVGGGLLCSDAGSGASPLAKLRLPQAFCSGKREYTLAMWVKATARNETSGVLYREGIHEKDKVAWPLQVQLNKGRLEATCRGNYVEASPSASEAATPAGSIPSDRWCFLALALTPTPSGRMLHITIDDKTWEDDFTRFGNLKGGFGLLGGIDGIIDEVVFFDRALTEQEVESLRKRELPESVRPKTGPPKMKEVEPNAADEPQTVDKHTELKLPERATERIAPLVVVTDTKDSSNPLVVVKPPSAATLILTSKDDGTLGSAVYTAPGAKSTINEVDEIRAALERLQLATSKSTMVVRIDDRLRYGALKPFLAACAFRDTIDPQQVRPQWPSLRFETGTDKFELPIPRPPRNVKDRPPLLVSITGAEPTIAIGGRSPVALGKGRDAIKRLQTEIRRRLAAQRQPRLEVRIHTKEDIPAIVLLAVAHACNRYANSRGSENSLPTDVLVEGLVEPVTPGTELKAKE